MSIAIIPARGGSRRIPGKNKRQFFGVPIIKYAIKAAKDSGRFERIIVSSDDEDILTIARGTGCTAHQRSADMSRDEVGTQEVAAHVLEWAGASVMDTACVIYPAVPLLDPVDLRFARQQLYGDPETQYVMSVGTVPELHDAGQFYWGNVRAFFARRPLIDRWTRMYPLVAWRDCDINTEEDWQRAEQMYGEIVYRRFEEKQTA